MCIDVVGLLDLVCGNKQKAAQCCLIEKPTVSRESAQLFEIRIAFNRSTAIVVCDLAMANRYINSFGI